MYILESGYKFNKSFQSRFQAYLGAVQLIPSGVGTRVNFNAVQFDPLNEYDEAILYQFTPLEAGYYYLEAGLQFQAMLGGIIYSIALNVNVNNLNTQLRQTIAGVLPMAYVSRFYYLIPTDVVWIQAYQVSGAGVNLSAGNTWTWFEGVRVG